jgi:hypothetical protein
MELENIVANTVYLKAREGKEMDFCLTLLLVTQDLPLVYSPLFFAHSLIVSYPSFFTSSVE